MLVGAGNNLMNTHVGGEASTHNASVKKSVNKYYNLFSKKMEEIELPNIDLEFNSVLIEDKSTVMWTA